MNRFDDFRSRCRYRDLPLFSFARLAAQRQRRSLCRYKLSGGAPDRVGIYTMLIGGERPSRGLLPGIVPGWQNGSLRAQSKGRLHPLLGVRPRRHAEGPLFQSN